MQLFPQEELVKIQARGLLTIPKKLRQELRLEESGLVRMKKEGGKLVIEPVRILPYPVRAYSDKEIEEFLELDRQETKKLKKKGLL